MSNREFLLNFPWVHGWAAKRGQASETSREAGEVERGSSGTRGERGPDIGQAERAPGNSLVSRGKTTE